MGILLVVLGHSYPFNVPVGQGFEFLRTFIYSFHMPLFVFLSGFLAAKSHHLPKDYITNRAGKLLIPYFVLSLAFFLPKVLLQSYLNDTVSFSFTYLVRSELIPRENVWGHFWFLPVIFYLGIFSVLLKTVFQKPLARTIILICS
jgi:fucose 4-O-acetylase-like acetyltransferase